MNRRFTALFLGLIFFIQIFFFSGFSAVRADVTQADVNKVINSYTSGLNPGLEGFNSIVVDAYRQIVAYQATLGPDNADQLEEYALQDMLLLLRYAQDWQKAYSANQTSPTVPAALAYLDTFFNNTLTKAIGAAKNGTKCVSFFGLGGCVGQDGTKTTDTEIARIIMLKEIAAGRARLGAGTSSSSTQQGVVENATRTYSAQVNTIQSRESAAGCTFSNWDILKCLDSALTYLVKTILLNFVTIFTWMFGMMFHYSVYFGVLKFQILAGESVPGAPLLLVWEMIRNLVNLVVIFFGFGLAILYLINKGDDLKKFIPWLIVYVLFVNFSWTISRTLVDYSNVATLKMYEMTIPGALNNTDLSFTGSSAATELMKQMGLQTLITKITKVAGVDGATSNLGNTDFEDKITSTPVALLYVIMAGYLAYAFLVAAIIFALRSVLLLVFIVFSPFLLVDVALPWVGSYAAKARNIFYSQLAVGFIFMVFLYVTLGAMTAVNGGLNAVSSSAGATASPGIVSFFGLLMMLILLHIMLKSVRALSPMIGNAASVIMGSAIGIASGGTALAARATLGAGAARFANSAVLDRMQDTRIGRGLKSASTRMANGSMDLRNLSSVKSFAKRGGITLQDSKSEGYSKELELKAKTVSATALGIKDDAVREKYLLSQGKAAQLYRNSRNTRDAEYAKSKGGARRELFDKNVDLRNVAFERDRAEATAENKARSMTEEQKRLEADHAEGLVMNRDLDNKEKNDLSVYKDHLFKENKQAQYEESGERMREKMLDQDRKAAEKDNVRIDAERKVDSERNWSEARPSSKPDTSEDYKKAEQELAKWFASSQASKVDLTTVAKQAPRPVQVTQGAQAPSQEPAPVNVNVSVAAPSVTITSDGRRADVDAQSSTGYAQTSSSSPNRAGTSAEATYSARQKPGSTAYGQELPQGQVRINDSLRKINEEMREEADKKVA